MPKTKSLVSTDWLRDQAGRDEVVVLDASIFLYPVTNTSSGGFRSGADSFEKEGHIPGARFADLITQFSDPKAPYPFTRPSRRQFEEAAGHLGITADTHVVVYDGLIGQWAARLWWVFRSFGHRSVSVLDGGLKKYVGDGGALVTTLVPYAPTVYKSGGRAGLVAGLEDVLNITQGTTKGHLVCLLPPEDYAGSVSVRGRRGHIPKSANLPFAELINADTNTLLPPEALRSAFATRVPLDGRVIVTYCGGGIASTLGALALDILGYENALEYDGSLAEWADQAHLPLETGH